MQKVRIATWNINSVRHRIQLVSRFLRAQAPDVLCLQETKVTDELFPAAALAKLGYVHQALNGQKAYHGVAVLSRQPFKKTAVEAFCSQGHARHMSVTFGNGLELHNFYVPAGGDIPDPQTNPKFAHKLEFLQGMEKFFAARKARRREKLVAVGDFNVAPLEHDVWSHKQLLNVVSHTPIETRLLGAAQAAFDWTDVTRHFVAPKENIYSWWSYRAADWQASDRGRRLDHIWVSPGLKDALRSQTILKKMRGWEKASDHVPVVMDLEL
jgi:exodeoxyribonuclease-3